MEGTVKRLWRKLTSEEWWLRDRHTGQMGMICWCRSNGRDHITHHHVPASGKGTCQTYLDYLVELRATASEGGDHHEHL
jgi:hypothetical protein